MTDAMRSSSLMEIRGVRVEIATGEHRFAAVDGVDLEVPFGRCIGVVGESGCGKTLMAMALLQLLPQAARLVDGEVHWRPPDGAAVDLAALAPDGRDLAAVRGGGIGVVFQEPLAAMSPVHTVGRHIAAALRAHGGDRTEERARSLALLRDVRIPRPETVLDSYAHQLSGGMRQRAMIAVALAAHPHMLIADEPTTALDVTVQAQVLELLRDLRRERGMAMLLISHDFGVVAEIADEVAVMYLGRIVERAPVVELFDEPRHPYTRGLLASRITSATPPKTRLAVIAGQVPRGGRPARGCGFFDRCPVRVPGTCDVADPPVHTAGSRMHACVHP